MIANIEIARRCFHFADLAYEEFHDEDRATSTQIVYGGMLDEPGSLVVGVRGTQELRDFLTDARFAFKTKWPGSALVGIHRGVAAAVEAILPKVVSCAQNFKRVYLAGHSLGGMKAQPIALRLSELGFDVAGVQVFGCPRVGNGYFRNYYNAHLGNATLRWEAQGDPFPYSPPLVCNYRHAGRAAYLKNDGRVIFEPTFIDHVPAYAQTIVHLPQSVTKAELFGIFDPHHRANYKRLLKEAA